MTEVGNVSHQRETSLHASPPPRMARGASKSSRNSERPCAVNHNSTKSSRNSERPSTANYGSPPPSQVSNTPDVQTPDPRTPDLPAPSPLRSVSSNTSSPRKQVTIEVGTDDEEPTPPQFRRPRTYPVTPSPIGPGGDVFHPQPSRSIGPAPPSQQQADPVDDLTNPVETFSKHLSKLQFRSHNRPCEKYIHFPDSKSITNESCWYYVTVGKTVGIFVDW